MKFIADFIKLVLSKGLNTPLLLLETALIGRILGPDGFGQWSLLMATATMMHSVFLNWTHAITLRYGCEEWSQNQSLGRTYATRWPILCFALICITALLYFQPLHWLERIYLVKPALAWLILLNTLSLWLMNETQSSLQATSAFSQQALLTPTVTLLSIGLLTVIIFHVNSADLILVAAGCAMLRVMIWGAVWLKNLYSAQVMPDLPSYTEVRSALKYSWPLLPTFVLGYLSDWGDHVLLGWFCTTADVGLWGASYQIMLGVISINSVLVTLLFPWLINKQQNMSNAASYYVKDVIPVLLSFWLFIVIILVTLFPTLFKMVMGDQFKQANDILLILSFSILTNVFSNIYGILFNLQNRLRVAMLYSFIMVIINFVLSLALIPKIGLTGAAIGTSISYLIGHLLYIRDQHRFLSVPTKPIIVLFTFALISGVLQYFAGGELLTRTIACVISLFLLIVTIRKTGSIHPLVIQKVFTGILSPIGLIIERILVTNHVNEYH